MSQAMGHGNVGIVATGSYLPKHEVDNDELAERVGVAPEWIERKTMIRGRRFAAPDEATSDLATHAARRALQRAGIGADQIGYLVVATSTGDFPQPPTSYLVQHNLGADRAVCFDVNTVCSGFLFGLAVARSLLTLSPDTYALVIGADVYSRILDFTDRRTAVIFGDGAGAAVLGVQPAPYGIMDIDLQSVGGAHSLVGVEAGGSRNPASIETVNDGMHFFRMEGRRVREFVAEYLPPLLNDLVDRHGIPLSRIDHFVPHQANGVMLNEIVESVGLGGACTHRTLHKFGNVGSASVAVTLDQACRTGALSDGDLVLLAAFGGGMSLGASLMRWHCEGVRCLPR